MRKDARENRQEILKVARLLFAQYGQEVSMRTIASTVGVGIATLYRNFPTRTALVLGIAEQVSEEVGAILDKCFATWDDDPEAAWRTFIHSVAELKMSGLLTNFGPSPEVKELVTELREIRRRSLERLEEVLRRAKDAGFVAEGVGAEQLHVGLAIITRPLPELPVLESQPEQTWLVDTFIKGIRPD